MREHDAESRLWGEVEQVSKSFHRDEHLLGKLCFQLRNLYSERADSAAGRRSSGHGTFQAELLKRGFKPNRVREWITDYMVAEGLRPPSESTAAKRKQRRSSSAAVRSTHAAPDDDPVTRFAALLPYSALKSAYRTALQELHPDHGGSNERTQELIRAWAEVEKLHSSDEVAHDHATVQ